MTTIKACDVDVKALTYSKQPTVLPSGAKMVWLNYNGAPMTVQLPAMKAPFGVSTWCDDKGAVEKYSVDLSFGGESEEVRDALKLFEALDQYVLQSALDNSEAWFKKKYTSLEVVDALYNKIVRYPKDDKYAPTIKLALPVSNGELQCTVFDGDKNKIDLLTRLSEAKGCQVTAIIQPSIWISGNKFGCKWKVRQMKCAFRAALNEYAFIDDEPGPAGSDDDEGGRRGGDDFGSDLDI